MFEMEKETKGTVRFKEINNGSGRDVIGNIYIIKDVLPKPFPEKIEVNIEFK
jgi:hypothetical protein